MIMCRNIKTLHNFEPPATDEEIRASSLEFVRKPSGFTGPSHANHVAFDRAVEKVSQAARELIDSLVTNAPPRDHELEAMKARARASARQRRRLRDQTRRSGLATHRSARGGFFIGSAGAARQARRV
jgi:hypothetical protein